MAQKPNVIIFGGINELAPMLALHLVPLSGEPLVSHLRIVDKYIMNPPTTYVINDFLRLLQEQKDFVDYKQANLTVPATVAKCFTDPAPNAQPYTHIIDLTGEMSFYRPAEVFIAQTFNISLLIAHEAAKNSVKSYLRYAPSFYEHIEDKVYKETDMEGWQPWGTRGIWWHETLRAVGSIPNLPFVFVRGAMPYGPGYVQHGLTTALLVGLIYKHLDLVMKFGWSPHLRKNTIHTLDWVGAIWATSLWAGEHDRAELNATAGVHLPPSEDSLVEITEGTIKKASGGVLVPVINLVDTGDLTLHGMGDVVSKVFDINISIQGTLEAQQAKMNFELIAEDVNDFHVREWRKIIANSDPPVPSTPLTPYAQGYQLRKQGCAMDGSRLKSVVGYTIKYPAFDADTARDTIESWRAEGIWPNTPLYPPS